MKYELELKKKRRELQWLERSVDLSWAHYEALLKEMRRVQREYDALDKERMREYVSAKSHR